MKKTLACLLATAAMSLGVACDSQALTDAQHRQFLKTSQEYRAADAQLNSVWRTLKGQLSPAEFRQLLQEQRHWLNTQREGEARELMSQSIPAVDAYTATITSRAKELGERVGKPAAPAVPAPAAKPAPATPKAETPASPAAPKAEAPAKPAASTPTPAAAPAKPEAPAKAETPSDKPARVEIGLPYLEEEPAPAAKPAPAAPTAPRAAKPAAKPAKPAPQAQNGAPKYWRAYGTPEHPVATGDASGCSGLQITSSRHYGNNVAVPFVEMVLRNDRMRSVKVVRVNGYEIAKSGRSTPEMPQWKPVNSRAISLDVFAHTILNNIDVEYADGSVCTIDKRGGDKDYTNPYVY